MTICGPIAVETAAAWGIVICEHSAEITAAAWAIVICAHCAAAIAVALGIVIFVHSVAEIAAVSGIMTCGIIAGGIARAWGERLSRRRLVNEGKSGKLPSLEKREGSYAYRREF